MNFIVGEPRLGWLIDGNPKTPETAVMLQDTGSVIELRIPLQGILREDGLYTRWWSSLTMYADDPERTNIVILLHVSCYFMIIAVMLL